MTQKMEEYTWISIISDHPVFAGHAHPVLRRLASLYGVNITIKGPSDTSGEKYIKAINDAVKRKVAGIMLIGFPVKGVVAAVSKAIDSNIPVVTVDSDIPHSRRIAHVGTNWFKMGSGMADKLAELTGNKGKVLMLGMKGLANMEAGFRGFRQRMSDYPGMDIIGCEDDMDATTARAEKIVEEYLENHPDLSGIVGFDGNSGPGAARVLEKRGKHGDIKVLCVDADEMQAKHIKTGAIDAAFCQKREVFTSVAFQMLYSFNHGSAITGNIPGKVNIIGNIDTGHIIVTKDNLNTVEEELRLDEIYQRHNVIQRCNLLTNMVENIDSISMAVDSSGMVVYANPSAEKQLGYDHGKLVRVSIDKLFVLSPGIRDKMQDCLGRGIPASFDTVARKSEGAVFPVHVNIAEIKTGFHGKGIVLFAVNNTGRKRMEEEILRKNQELESFVYSVSHDLRSPLVSLYGYAENLYQGNMDKLDDQDKHYFNRIFSNIKKMEELIHDLLELSRIGRVIGERTDVKVREILREAAARFSEQLKENDIDVEVTAEGGCVINVDKKQIAKVMDNLMSNAIKYMGNGRKKHIELSCGKCGDNTRICVKDTGMGIDKKYHDKIFEIFQRIGGGKEETEGTGIGLAIVDKIIKGHDGRVWVDSALGKGSEFCFEIPRKKGES